MKDCENKRRKIRSIHVKVKHKGMLFRGTDGLVHIDWNYEKTFEDAHNALKSFGIPYALYTVSQRQYVHGSAELNSTTLPEEVPTEWLFNSESYVVFPYADLTVCPIRTHITTGFVVIRSYDFFHSINNVNDFLEAVRKFCKVYRLDGRLDEDET